MKKYFYIFKTSLIDKLQYTFNLVCGFFGFFVMIFVFVNLWHYIYNDPNELINGYTYSQMIWYAIITEIIYKLCNSKVLTTDFIKDIKSGNIAYNLNKPYNYVIYTLSRYFGDTFIIAIISLIIGPLVGFLFAGKLVTFKLISIPFCLLSIIFALLISSLIYTSISLLSFWMEDSYPFNWVYKKILIVIGILFPVEFFPKVIQPIIKCSPVYVITYGPAKLLINFDFKLFITITIAQIIYIIILVIIVSLLYRKGVKKINVNGG